MNRSSSPFVSVAAENEDLRGTRRPVRFHMSKLDDGIVAAFEKACEDREFDVARELLGTFEELTLRRRARMSVAERNRLVEWLVGSHFRLLELRS